MERLRHVVEEAAQKLDAFLDDAEQLYIHSLIATETSIIKLCVGFGTEAQLWHYDIVLVGNVYSLSGALQCLPGVCSFPVFIDEQLLTTTRAYCSSVYIGPKDTLTGFDESKAELSHRTPDSLDDFPHLVTPLFSCSDLTFDALIWICNPESEAFFSTRYHRVNTVLSEHKKGYQHGVAMKTVIKEIALVDLLLYLRPKLKPLWQYRLWLFTQLITYDLLKSYENDEPSKIKILSRVCQLSNVTALLAADRHPMNYNAWHYRRCASKVFICALAALTSSPEKVDKLADADLQHVLEFVRVHNGDTSAASYLLFLLAEQETRDQARAKLSLEGHTEGSPAALQSVPQATVNAAATLSAYSSSSKLWKVLMQCTQEEIRRHCEKGHESMWYLRLELVRWAVTRSSWCELHSSWNIEDELVWVSAYADAFTPTGSSGLLSPSPALSQARTESFGTLAWTSYNAARYGLQLLSLLGFYPINKMFE